MFFSTSRLLVIVFIFLFSTFAHAWFFDSPDFKPGECLKAKDGFIWKVSRIEDDGYVLQGWFNKWGNETKLGFDIIAKKFGHTNFECPIYQLTTNSLTDKESISEGFKGCVMGATIAAQSKKFTITKQTIINECADALTNIAENASDEQVLDLKAHPYVTGCIQGVDFIYKKMQGKPDHRSKMIAVLKEFDRVCRN